MVIVCSCKGLHLSQHLCVRLFLAVKIDVADIFTVRQ